MYVYVYICINLFIPYIFGEKDNKQYVSLII